MNDFEQYLNWLQLDPISFLVNFSHELAQIITTYDFLSAKQAILILFVCELGGSHNYQMWPTVG